MWGAGRVPRLQLARLPRIPSQKVLVLDSVRAARRRLARLALLALATLSVTVGLAYRGTAAPASGGAPRYVLVVDAGSSGTRMYAYTWRDSGGGGPPPLAAVPSTAAPHKVPRRALPGKRAYQRVETEPGLDSFADDPAGLENRALGPLLEWAEAVVPPNQWAQTPIFLFGTAGLRRLSEAQQAALLGGCRGVLGRASFRFEPPWVRIISGADEGVYGWIALNYLEGMLQGSGGDARGETLGALDLGGSSLEVTFAADSVPWKEDAVNATVLGTSHQLYAHVHHHYGLNDAFDRGVSLLLSRSGPGAAGNASAHPADAGGTQQQQGQQGQQQQQQQQEKLSGVAAGTAAKDSGDGKQTASEKGGAAEAAGQQGAAGTRRGLRQALAAPVALQRRLQLTASDGGGGSDTRHPQRQVLEDPPVQVEHPCLHNGYRHAYKRLQLEGAEQPHPAQVTLVGRSDYAACQALAREVVNADVPCAAPPCALGTPQPSSAGHRFVALTGFYVVYRFFRLAATAPLADLDRAGREFCGKSWAAVQAERPGELMVEDYCFRAPYITALLSEGLLLKDQQLRIGDGDVGWTLGAALAEGYRLGGLGQRRSGLLPSGAWASPGPVWLLAGGASAAFLLWLVLAGWRQRRLRSGTARSSRAGLGLPGLGLGAWPPASRSWLQLLAWRGGGGPSSKLSSKGSGQHLDLAVGDTPLSTERSSLSDDTTASLPPSGRSTLSGWAPLDGGGAAAPQVPAGAVGGSANGSATAGPRSLSWAALHDAPAGGSGLVQQEEGPPLSRLGRSRTYSRRSLASPDGDPVMQ